MIVGIDASKAARIKKTGIDNTAYQIIFRLQKYDRKNQYLLYTNSHLDASLIKQENFRERLIPFPKFWNRFRLPLALISDKPDVFLELTSNLPPFSPEKSIVLVHDLAFKIFPEAYSSYDIMLQETAIKIAITRAKIIIFTSLTNQEDFFKYYKFPKKQTRVIPLGYNEKIFKASPVINNILNLNVPYFIFVGRLEKRKNVINIIKAFDKFRAGSKSIYKLLLIGKDGYGSSQIKEHILNSPNKSDILRPGYVKDKDLPSLYSHAEVLIYPSLYEGFGLPILEAMACQIPVITSKVPTLLETAGDAAYFVNPLDENDIADAMQILISNKITRANLIKNGLKNIKKYSWDRTAKEYYNLIESLK